MTPWGLAIQRLLHQAGYSRRKASQHHLAPYGAFSQWYVSKRGPNVATLDKLLTGIGLTWKDWAEAFERAKAETGTISKTRDRDDIADLINRLQRLTDGNATEE
jgi:hypothetical protein